MKISPLQPNQTVDVRVDCHTAVVHFRSTIDARFASLSFRHDAEHTNVYLKRDNRWIAASGQLTAIGGFPPNR